MPAAAATVSDTAEHEVVIDTKLVHAVFSNRGGVLTNWTLKKYTDTTGKQVDPNNVFGPRPPLAELAEPLSTAASDLEHVLSG